MKMTIGKLLFELSLFVYPSLGFAQDLKFLGIPIEGKLHTFVNKLKEKGYSSIPFFIYNRSYNGFKTKNLSGSFWKFPNCYVFPRAIKGSKDVSSVIIRPRSDYWLKDELIYSLDQKYGRHTEYNSTVNSDEETFIWKVTGGEIILFANTIPGQVFELLYRNSHESKILKNYNYEDEEL